MPSPDPDDAPSGGRESWLGPKGSRKRTAVQVAIGLAGLLIAYLIYRSQRRQNDAAAAGGAYTYPSLGNGSPVDTGIGDQLAAGFAAQSAAISSLQAQIGGNPTAATGPGATAAPNPYTSSTAGPAGTMLGALNATPTYTRYGAVVGDPRLTSRLQPF